MNNMNCCSDIEPGTPKVQFLLLCFGPCVSIYECGGQWPMIWSIDAEPSARGSATIADEEPSEHHPGNHLTLARSTCMPLGGTSIASALLRLTLLLASLVVAQPSGILHLLSMVRDIAEALLHKWLLLLRQDLTMRRRLHMVGLVKIHSYRILRTVRQCIICTATRPPPSVQKAVWPRWWCQSPIVRGCWKWRWWWPTRSRKWLWGWGRCFCRWTP